MAEISDRDLQELQILAGLRQAGSAGRAAVRVDDLAGLLQLPDNLKSGKAAGSTPTKAEHDALFADVQQMHLKLRAVIAAMRVRLGRT
jgi:hypothetical protein